MFADMAMKLEAARFLVYEALGLLSRREEAGSLTRMSSMAKCVASDMAMDVTTDAVQLLGGYGYTSSHPVERFMRDAKVTQIYEGTNQIQRVVIANEIFRGA
jgi:alkylation response protein AidB-like acyl-CoA dehydrogenase